MSKAAGVNFSGCKVNFHNMGSKRDTAKAHSHCSCRPAKKSKRQLKKEEMDCIKMGAIKAIHVCSIFHNVSSAIVILRLLLQREKQM